MIGGAEPEAPADDDEEYEDDFEQEQYFADRAQLFLTVTRQLAPPVAVILLLVRKLIKEDRERHKEIDENNHPDHNEYHITYARFVATRTESSMSSSVSIGPPG